MRENRQWAFVKFFLAVITLLSLALVSDAAAQRILVQDGFESHPLEELDEKWQLGWTGCKITSERVKTGKKSLAILRKEFGDAFTVSSIKTDEPIVSAEFYVYIEKGGRSFGFRLASDDRSIIHNRGPEVGWNAGFVEFYANNTWQQIGKFPTDKWQYVRIVANFDRSVFDFYSGDSRPKALRAKPRKRIPFRREASAGATVTRISLFMRPVATPAYIDDLFVYEGDKPIAPLAVEPARKLATVWGHIKRH